jgi:ABC-type sugar transport system ATPase subunit
MGLRPSSGTVILGDHDISAETPHARLQAGIGYIPEDRQEDGLVGEFPVADNLILDVYDQPPFARGIALDLDQIRATATARVPEFDIRTASIAARVASLSGGNQQKVILAGNCACCWPASPPAAWTSARSSSCTGASSSSATVAWPSSSCPRNWTRSTRSPTGSR